MLEKIEREAPGKKGGRRFCLRSFREPFFPDTFWPAFDGSGSAYPSLDEDIRCEVAIIGGEAGINRDEQDRNGVAAS